MRKFSAVDRKLPASSTTCSEQPYVRCAHDKCVYADFRCASLAVESNGAFTSAVPTDPASRGLRQSLTRVTSLPFPKHEYKIVLREGCPIGFIRQQEADVRRGFRKFTARAKHSNCGVLGGMLHELSRDSVGFHRPIYVNRRHRVTAHYRRSFSALGATRLVNCIASLSYPNRMQYPG